MVSWSHLNDKTPQFSWLYAHWKRIQEYALCISEYMTEMNLISQVCALLCIRISICQMQCIADMHLSVTKANLISSLPSRTSDRSILIGRVCAFLAKRALYCARCLLNRDTCHILMTACIAEMYPFLWWYFLRDWDTGCISRRTWKAKQDLGWTLNGPIILVH